MLQLSSVTEKLQIVPGIVGDLDVTVTYTDRAAGVDSPDSQDTPNITAATATDILAVPGASTKRRVRWISVRNAHASVISTPLIQKLNTTGSVVTEVMKVTSLGPGEELVLSGTGVWFVHAADGSVKSSNQPGRWLRTRRFTSGTSFVVSADCNRISVTVIGGGGGGGGCTSVASAAAAAGGGGSGARGEKTWDVTPGATINYTIGAGGTGTSAAAGGNGGASTITGPDAVVVTAPGGLGAPLATALTTLSTKIGGDGGGIATNGDFNKGGNPGAPGIIAIVAGPNGVSGNGGSGMFGDGALGLGTAGNGVVGGGNGAGGSGGLTGATAARAGGAGSGGIIVVEEYS